ncbi:MAG: phospholipase D-like domain-containing protein [Candidatus Latescibacteria bacterium]|jgi:uncharacterized protein YcfJ|nr:phospholipase D-like domain-containing protein [Candidatus Latescibacterota bacterium]
MTLKEKITRAGVKGARQTLGVASEFVKHNPAQTGGTLAGLGVGTGAGYLVGGSIGVVAFGGGIGIPIVVICAAGGVIAGNRLGIARDKRMAEERLQERSELLQKLVQENNRKKIKPIDSLAEHQQELSKALISAKHTICILSGWATSYVVDKEFQQLLRKCLSRGVDIYIGYGYQNSKKSKPKKGVEKEAEKNLTELNEWCALEKTKGRLIVRYFPNHSKLLICDDRYAVNGSFNWLSNVGEAQGEERSWIVYDKDFVETERDIVVTSLTSILKTSRRGLLTKVIPFSDR